MQRCLVLGGDGFIGSHLVESLLEKGHSVVVFGRFKKNKVKNLNHVRKRIELFSGDFLITPNLEKTLEGIDCVFHFISSSNPVATINKPREEIELNILPTINLLSICARKGVKKIIFPSSGGSIYGNYPRGKVSEEDLLNPISPHAIGKLFIEQFLYYYFIQFKIDYVIYRISNVYGERQEINKDQGVIPIILHRALRGETIEIYGNTIRDYIYVSDVANFIAENFDKKHNHRIYNIGSGKGTTLYRILNIIKEQTGPSLHIKKLARRSSDVQRIILGTERVRQEFNFSLNVTLAEGIKKTYNAIRLKLL